MGGTSGALLEIFFRAMAGHMTTIGATPTTTGATPSALSTQQQAVEWSTAMWKVIDLLTPLVLET